MGAAGEEIHQAPRQAAEEAERFRREGRLGSAERIFREALDIRPDDPSLRHGLARLLLESDRFREARGLFFSLAPAAATPRLRAAILAGAGEALLGEGRASEAVAPLREAAVLAPEDPDLCRRLALALEGSGELRAAANTWAAVRALRPDFPEPEARRRRCLQLEADLNTARHAVRHLPADPDALLRLAALEEAAARPAAAAAALGQALAQRPSGESSQLRLHHALLLLRTGDAPAAERELRGLTATAVALPAALYSIAALRARAGDREGEAKAWEAVVAGHPGDLFAQRAWARAVALAGDLDAARAAEARRPETFASLVRRALLAQQVGDIRGSAVALAAAAGVEPNDDSLAEAMREFVGAGTAEAAALRAVSEGEALRGGVRTRGALRLWLGEGPAGLTDLETAEHDHPDDPRGKVALAYAYRLAGRRAASQRLLAEAVRLDPGYVPARLEQAADRLQRGEAAAALADAEAAARAAPDSALAHALVGAALLQLDRAQGAVAALARGLAVEPADPRGRLRPLLLRGFTRLGDLASVRELLSLSVLIEPELQYQLAFAQVRDSFVGEGFQPDVLRVWRTRYRGALRDEVDARAAIGALIASLDDPYTRLRSPADAIARLETVRGVDLLADPRGRVAPGSPTVLSRVLDEGVLYLRLTNLEDATVAEQVEAVLASSPDAPQVILDLRGNPGGYEHLAEEVAALLAPVEGPLRIQEARDGRSPRTPRAPGRGGERRLKVLVDGGTASAAEHLASALGGVEDVEVVGGATSGKNVVQYPYILPDGWTLLVTCARIAPARASGS